MSEFTKIQKYIKCNNEREETVLLASVLEALSTFENVSEKIAQKEAAINEYDTVMLYGQLGKGGGMVADRFFGKELSLLPDWFVLEGRKYCEGALQICDESWLSAAGVKAFIPVGEGGLYKALFRLWEMAGKGFEIDYSVVEVSQFVIELCEIFDFDPWRLLSGDCALIVTDTPGALKGKAQIIGYMNGCKDKLIVHREVVSRLDRPKRDEILRIL